MIFKHVDYGTKIDDIDSVTNTDGVRHYVTPSGSRYPSITTILGAQQNDALDKWKKRVGEEEARAVAIKASRRGNTIHTLCENYLNNVPGVEAYMPYDVAIWNKLRPILDKYVTDIHAQEIALWSDHLGIAGRCDCIGMFDGKLSIIDFKTSLRTKKKQWIDKYFIQECAYAIMWEERTGIPINRLVTIIGVDNKPSQIFVEKRDTWVPELKKAINNYKNLLDIPS
jgi:hypothetical protein